MGIAVEEIRQSGMPNFSPKKGYTLTLPPEMYKSARCSLEGPCCLGGGIYHNGSNRDLGEGDRRVRPFQLLF